MDRQNLELARSGPLRDIRVVEFAGIGPGPFAAMLLSDMGADVVTIARPGQGHRAEGDFVQRGRRVVELDLKLADDQVSVRNLIGFSDILIEGFRPGVMERLGLGPEEMLSHNPKLIYGRMTGWGQDGPLAQAAGHDINYIAITGALDCFRSKQGEPVSPLNLVGDFGGGALYLVVGVLAALNEVRISGRGQVVDAAMCDGVSNMLTYFQSRRALGLWRDGPRANVLEGASHFYNSYECSDGKYIAVAAIEPQFYAKLRELARLDDPAFDQQRNPEEWPALTQMTAEIFKMRTRDEWAVLLEKTDACAQPVISLSEAPSHPHLLARGVYTKVGAFNQPAPAPRFSRTPSAIQGPASVEPMAVNDVLDEWRPI
ncbi:CoA transferase [Bradyrhizobium sp. AUGA SZCCT0240]|uniref:CaiB/BaiF CoA transferase family protein n=1 Tax=Bradyrhizobium sp. AUGA SZCCT0240 TaxID=2807669 RepID=UPI001BA442C3|nr:CaiB/BaiF CoA-transferase family protein [Bradyrhizobium sp. AUGA SZCCT0240]MBR1256333.1 CoA transferase [Bradyrhizobium sp. AUGA SZCCT0240]